MTAHQRSKPTPSPTALGAFLRQAREAHGYSLTKLAGLVSVHHSFLPRLEAGVYARPAPELLQRLATALELPIEDLFALAGYEVAEKLPTFPAYLRSKYEMSPEAASQLTEYFGYLQEKYGITEKHSGPKQVPEPEIPDIESAAFTDEHLDRFRAA